MKGVILAAGKGTRMKPFTAAVTKTILPVYNKPVIYHSAMTLVRSGVQEILVVTNSKYKNQIVDVLGSAKKLGAKSLDYKVKNHNLGIPFSILQAEKWSDGNSIMVVPGDNIFTENFKEDIELFENGALVFLRKVNNPSRFGVPVYRGQKLINIVEKPKKPQTNFALISPYVFDNRVFDIIKSLKPSSRGELEIVDVMKHYLKINQLKLVKKEGVWWDVGTIDDLLDASLYFKIVNDRVVSGF